MKTYGLSPLFTRMTQMAPSTLRQMSLADFWFNSGTNSINQCLVAAESEAEPPPGTNTSENTFKNWNMGWNFNSPVYT